MEQQREGAGLGWGLHEECGVFGIYDPAGGCAQTVYYGLYALQHRGQEACGIAAVNDREQSFYKDVGLVSEVFNKGILNRLNGTMAVSHVRYATTGAGERENAQPLIPDQQSREQAVRIKLPALRSEVAGKRVVMVDNSIVRGTTCRQIINLLREAGATEVHMRVSAPPLIAPCYFGTDIPNKEKLIERHVHSGDALCFAAQGVLRKKEKGKKKKE